MADPVFDAKSYTIGTSGTTITNAHTVSGVNPVLLAFSVDHDNLGTSGVTYNGVAMTKAANASTQAGIKGDWWYLINPPAGTYNIVATYGGTITKAAVIGLSYNNIKQSAQPDANADASGSTTSSGNQSTDITTIANNSMIVGFQMVTELWGAVAIQSPFTSRYDQIDSGLGMTLSCGDYLLATAGVQAVSFYVVGYEGYIHALISLAPFVAGVNAAGVTRMMEVF